MEFHNEIFISNILGILKKWRCWKRWQERYVSHTIPIIALTLNIWNTGIWRWAIVDRSRWYIGRRGSLTLQLLRRVSGWYHFIRCETDSSYHRTEAGGLSRYLPRNPGLEWAYFRVPDLIPHDFIPHGDGIFELVVFVSRHFTTSTFSSGCSVII